MVNYKWYLLGAGGVVGGVVGKFPPGGHVWRLVILLLIQSMLCDISEYPPGQPWSAHPWVLPKLTAPTKCHSVVTF